MSQDVHLRHDLTRSEQLLVDGRPMKIFVGFPTRIWINGPHAFAHFAWMVPALRSSDVQLGFAIAYTANRFDMDRSNLIDVARKNDIDWHIQMDDDCGMEVPIRQVLQLLEDCRKRGFDAVISPTASSQMRVMAYPVEGVDAKNDTPFEIQGGSCAFLALSKKALNALEPMGQFGNEDGSTVPAFTENSMAGDDSILLWSNLRQHGIRGCADPRILTRHYKGHFGIPSWRPNPKLTIEDK